MGRAARPRGLRRGRRRRNVGVRAGGDRGAGDLPRARPSVARLSRVAPLPRRPAALSARRGAHRDRPGARPAARVGPAPPAALVGPHRRWRVRRDDPHPTRPHDARAVQVDLGLSRARPARRAAPAGDRPRDQRREDLGEDRTRQHRALGSGEAAPGRLLRRIPRGIPRGPGAGAAADRSLPCSADPVPPPDHRDVGHGDGRDGLREGPWRDASLLRHLPRHALSRDRRGLLHAHWPPAAPVSRNAHCHARADDVPAAPRRRSVVHRGAADAGHRRRQRAAHPAHRHHPPVRGLRRLVARDELDARSAPHARERRLRADPGDVMARPVATNIRALTLALAVAFLVASVGVAYWTMFAAESLAQDPFNPRLIAASRDRPRGQIVDRNNAVLADSVPTPDGFKRTYKDRTLAQVTGYASFQFGLSGVEAAYADSLIGQDAADPASAWRAPYLPERPPPRAVALGIDRKGQKAGARGPR